MDVQKRFLYRFTVGLTKILEFFLYLFSFAFMPITKTFLSRLLMKCDIQVNGDRRWDPKVKDNRFYCQIAKKSYFGFVDAYSRGYIECEDLTALLLKIYSSKHYKDFCMHPTLVLRSFFERKFFTQTKSRAFRQGKVYDERADSLMAADEEGRTMSTGYWREARNLKDASIAKLDLIARKLKLKAGMKVLDIGCGEGTLCKHLATKYGVEVVGINVSGDHLIQARRICHGLKVKFYVKDARQITGKFDRITCVATLEHLGLTDYRDLFKTIRNCLVDDGIFLIETGSTNHRFVPTFDAPIKRWFNMHINYSYYLDLAKSFEGLFVIEDWQNLRKHFELTTLAWREEYDRMWNKMVSDVGIKNATSIKAGQCHLAAFACSRYIQTYQIVLSKNGLTGGYEAVV